ncbi:MAG: helix-turn-helix domain-containing protein [Paludibacteraceae bacterium]|nr:helix-turn-helix domain-containing protein [Paludibacteraceae bacterium]
MNERERLIEIMNSQGLTAKQLSLELGVSAGTLSNILGGRNKPSLELLKSIATHYPFIKSDWLFLGKGEMYEPDYIPPVSQSPAEPDLFTSMENNPSSANPTQSCSHIENILASKNIPNSSPRTVDKIMIFYSDGTFEER